MDGTAVGGQDYASKNGTLSFGPNATSRTIEVSLLGDDLPEATESLFVRLSNPAEATGLIADDDDCQSLTLLRNGSSEEDLEEGEVPGWTEVRGSSWSRIATVETIPHDGATYFNAVYDVEAELSQDVDLSSFASWIDRISSPCPVLPSWARGRLARSRSAPPLNVPSES